MADDSVGFRPPCWCPSRWAPTWRLHTNIYKSGENVSPLIFHKKNCCDLNLGESPALHIYLFSFLRFWTLSIERFWFLFWDILNGSTPKTSSWFFQRLSKKSQHLPSELSGPGAATELQLWLPKLEHLIWWSMAVYGFKFQFIQGNSAINIYYIFLRLRYQKHGEISVDRHMSKCRE